MSTVTFNGHSNTEYGIIVSDPGRRQKAEEQIDIHEIPYRDGYLHDHSGKYASYRREMVFGLKDISDIKDISSWLNGRAKLETSIDPGGYFMASVVGQIECERMSKRFTLARVTFECDPFFYLTSGDTTVTDTSSPLALTNLGTVAAAPYIKITGSGEVVLTINDVTTIFTVSTYIECDSLLQLCYKDTLNMGTSMVGEYPVLPTGTVNVSWTGTVTKVEIKPRWREL